MIRLTCSKCGHSWGMGDGRRGYWVMKCPRGCLPESAAVVAGVQQPEAAVAGGIGYVAAGGGR